MKLPEPNTGAGRQVLTTSHVPRFVAAGDVSRTPYYLVCAL